MELEELRNKIEELILEGKEIPNGIVNEYNRLSKEWREEHGDRPSS